MKKRFATLILTVTVCLGLVFTTAWATDAMDDSASGMSKIITGFEELQDYYLSFDSKPSLTDLMSQLPSEVNVYLEGEDTASAIPVTWESEQDYAETDEGYYLFWAMWDDSYELSDGYDIEAYRPFFEVEINESQSNENQPTNYRSASSSGIDHIVARAYQQLQISWTPVKNVDGYLNSKGELTATYKKDTTYYGIPYGQLVDSGEYMPNAASYDTFLKAVKKSDSVFYTTRGSNGKLKSTYYADDCSAFVSYAYDLPRMTTSTIAKSSQFSKVSKNSVYNAQVGDCFNRASHHVELITDISYDGNGKVDLIEVSEQTPPQTRTVTYTAKALQKLIDDNGYTLLRYKNCNSVDKPDSYSGYNPISMNVSARRLVKGETATIDAAANSNITYQSSDESVATVDESGTVTGISNGTATISVCAEGTDQYLPSIAKIHMTVDWFESPIISKIAVQSNGIQVYWNDVGAAKYRLYRKTDDGWEKVGTTTGTSYIDESDDIAVPGESYTYTVRCISDDGKKFTSNYDTKGKSITYLSQPKLSSVANTADGVKVTWEKVDGAEKYRLFRKTDKGSWTKVADTTSASYTDTTAKSGTTYIYTVRCLADDGKSYSSSYNKSGLTIKYLAQPSVSLSNASSGITVKWDKVTGASSYRVYRAAPSDTAWTKLTTIKSSAAISYTDKTAKAGVEYRYTVKAVSGSTLSSYNTKLYVIRLTEPSVSLSNSAAGVTVQWNKIKGATGYRVYRKTGDDTWRKIADIDGGSTVKYVDETAKSGTIYQYTVRATADRSISSYKTSGVSTKFLAPPSIKLQNVSSGVKVTWDKVSGASSYRVYRAAPSDTAWTKLTTVKSSAALSYTDKTAKAGVKYRYTVRAVSGDYLSAYDTRVSIIRLTQPDVSVEKVSSGIKVKWGKVTAATGYRVYRKTGDDEWSQIADISDGSAVDYLDEAVEQGMTYQYTVRAISDNSISSYKASESITY